MVQIGCFFLKGGQHQEMQEYEAVARTLRRQAMRRKEKGV
jgi:hypothetical protein